MLFFVTVLFMNAGLAQIHGDIVDQKEKGIMNATIIAIDSVRNSADTVKSDSRGFYAFKGLQPGRYKMEARAAGFQTAIIRSIEVRVGETGEIEDVDMYRGQRLDIILSPVKVPK